MKLLPAPPPGRRRFVADTLAEALRLAFKSGRGMRCIYSAARVASPSGSRLWCVETRA